MITLPGILRAATLAAGLASASTGLAGAAASSELVAGRAVETSTASADGTDSQPQDRDAEQCTAETSKTSPEVPWWVSRLDGDRLRREAGTNGSGITVAIVDSGVQATVRQFGNRVLGGTNVIGDGVPGNRDPFGHGTEVASIIAAAPASGVGLVGVAPGVRILPIRSHNGQSGDQAKGNLRSVAAGIDYAVQQGAQVINVSQAGYPASPGASDLAELKAAIGRAVARDALLVVAAGNDGKERNKTPWPGADPRVLAVGASDQSGGWADFSGYGPWLDVIAPGAEMVATEPGGGQCVHQGTSYAAPYVSGVAALIRSSPRHKGLSAEQVADRIKATADRIGSGWSPFGGWGRVQPREALLTEEKDLPKLAAAQQAVPQYLPPWPVPRQTPVGAFNQYVTVATVVAGALLSLAMVFAAMLVRDATARRARLSEAPRG